MEISDHSQKKRWRPTCIYLRRDEVYYEKNFVQSYYDSELHKKFQKLTQGSMYVEDYHKEMEMIIIRARIYEYRSHHS